MRLASNDRRLSDAPTIGGRRERGMSLVSCGMATSLRAAQIASGQEPDGGTFPFPYAPGRVQSERLPVAAGDHE